MLRRGALWANTRLQSLTNDGRHGNACGHIELGFENNQGTFAGQFGHEEEERLKVFPDSLHQRRDTGLCNMQDSKAAVELLCTPGYTGDWQGSVSILQPLGDLHTLGRLCGRAAWPTWSGLASADASGVAHQSLLGKRGQHAAPRLEHDGEHYRVV